MSQIGSIANGAFSCQSKILSAVFGSKCWYIGESAFEQCVNLEKINDDNVIEGIGVNAFASTKLHSVTFNKLESISSGVFNNCTNLTYISIPNCTTIGQSAFTNCNLLKEISFNNIQKIGNGAFISCNSLDKLNLNNCKEIGASAFKKCTNISQVSLSVCTRIGTNAFIDCPNLNRVYINNDKNIFCSLDTKKVFCECDNDEKADDCKITFFIKPECISYYQNNEKWKHYINNMVMLPENNQIIYFTNKGEKLEVKDNNYNNVYENGYGLLTCNNNNPIESLNINNIFKDASELTSIIIPPKCEKIEESSFKDNTSLNNIVLSDNLQSIEKYAFNNCKSLTSFTIPNTISELGDGIFAGCEIIKKIDGKYTTYYNKAVVYNSKLICVLPNTESRIKISDIDNNITSLGDSCFYGCVNLMRVDIPSNINEICDCAFEECKNLCEVHFEGTNPPSLGENVFKGINDFKIFVPEESFENYRSEWSEKGYDANIYPKPKDDSIIYYSDVQINSVDESKQTHKTYTYTNGNTEVTVTYHIISEVKNEVLPTNYFKQQSEITTVILGEKITKLNESAFEGCEKLTYVYLPFNTTKMKNRCFYGCNNLSKIYMPCPPIIKTLGDDIFCKCSSLTKFNVYDKKYVSDDNRCYILDHELKFFAQGGWTEGKGYIIPTDKNIIKINKSAFRESSISSIEFNSSIRTIGEYAFAYCTNLKSITNWKDGITTISKGAFEGCVILGEDTTIEIPKKLMSLGSFAFSGCKNLNFDYTDFIGNIETINESTFYNCEKLTKFYTTSNFTAIGNSAFEGCGELEEVSTSDNLKLINEKAFKGCKKLVTFKLPNSLTTIGDSAFEGCSSYKGYVYSNDNFDKDFNINDSTIIIDKKTKQTNTENSETTTLTIPTNVTSLGVACFKNSGITEMKILPSSKIKSIPNSAFESCKELISIDISNPQITTIGSKSFYGCTNLNGELRLSNSIKKIGDFAFSDCKNLTSVTLSSSLTELGNNSLSFGESNKIFIPLYLKPPTFTINGSKNNDSTPFGDTKNKSKDTFKIYIPPVLNKDYKNKDYYNQWEKYIDYYVDDESKIENYIDAVECVIANSVHKLLIVVKVGYNIPKDWYNTTIKFNIYTSNNKPIDENVEWTCQLSRYPNNYTISREVNKSADIYMTAEKMYFKILSTKNTITMVSKNYDGIKIDIDHVVNKNANYIEDNII